MYKEVWEAMQPWRNVELCEGDRKRVDSFAVCVKNMNVQF